MILWNTFAFGAPTFVSNIITKQNQNQNQTPSPRQQQKVIRLVGIIMGRKYRKNSTQTHTSYNDDDDFNP